MPAGHVLMSMCDAVVVSMEALQRVDFDRRGGVFDLDAAVVGVNRQIAGTYAVQCCCGVVHFQSIERKIGRRVDTIFARIGRFERERKPIACAERRQIDFLPALVELAIDSEVVLHAIGQPFVAIVCRNNQRQRVFVGKFFGIGIAIRDRIVSVSTLANINLNGFVLTKESDQI